MIGRELRRKLFGRHHGRFWGKRSRSRSASPPQHYHRRERERERRGIMRGGIIVVGEGGVEVIDTGEGMRVKGEGMEVVQGGAGVQRGKGVRSAELGLSSGIGRGRRRGSDTVGTDASSCLPLGIAVVC
ncbi:UNVERIFIED_CONTAM: hypothetical protein Sangu_2467500 [Sesamum angustifolium]|uniref:Uncharacterized protein n=1 Tax=Sesamum angustifolium TaxID=2727405 RepID=A0AAW2J1V1_9LAMI